MKKSIYMLLFLSLPAQSWANSCNQEVLERVANELQSEISRLPEPGEAFSADFREYEPLWRQTDARAEASMPKDLLAAYKNYKKHFETLDKIYNNNLKNKEIAKQYACHREFYTRDIYNALYGDLVTPIELGCDPFISAEDREALFLELRPKNLLNCINEQADGESEYQQPTNFLPTADRESDLPAPPPARLQFNRSKFDLSPDQQNRTSTAFRKSTSSEDFSNTEDTNFWKRFLNFFNRGNRALENDNQRAGNFRAENVFANYEIDGATRTRRANWENNRNYWIQRSVNSGQLTDRYTKRFESEILKTLNKTNDSLEESLKLIEDICRRQDVKKKCWGTNKLPKF